MSKRKFVDTMQIQMNLNANANTNAMQLHTGADANIKRAHCGCRCRRKRSNCNANANPISGIDKRGRQTKLCDIDSGTNHHLMQWKTRNCKTLKIIMQSPSKHMRHGPGELSAKRRGNRSQGDGGTALPANPNRYPFFTVRTPQATLVGELPIKPAEAG